MSENTVNIQIPEFPAVPEELRGTAGNIHEGLLKAYEWGREHRAGWVNNTPLRDLFDLATTLRALAAPQDVSGPTSHDEQMSEERTRIARWVNDRYQPRAMPEYLDADMRLEVNSLHLCRWRQTLQACRPIFVKPVNGTNDAARAASLLSVDAAVNALNTNTPFVEDYLKACHGYHEAIGQNSGMAASI